MTERVLHVLARNSHTVPTRVCGLLTQRKVRVTGLRMIMPTGSKYCCIEVTAVLERSVDVELAVNRLHRLVDVVEVLVTDAEPARPTPEQFGMVSHHIGGGVTPQPGSGWRFV